MKYIKLFETFSKPTTWKEKFNYIYNNFQKLKSGKLKEYSISVTIDDDDFSVSDLDFTKTMSDQIHLSFNKDELFVTDFENWDEDDPKNKDIDTKITLSEYNDCLKKAKEMDEWLDENSEKEVNSNKSKVSSTGELSLNFDETDLELDKLNDYAKEKVFNDFIGKSFQFDFQYFQWTSSLSNDIHIETHSLKIDDIELIIRPGLRAHIDIHTKDPIQHKNSLIRVYDDDLDKCDQVELSEDKFTKNVFTLYMVEDMETGSRKQEKDKWKNMKYPHIFSYWITPSKYDTTEFLKMMVNIVTTIENGHKLN
jgi:hypothetical protein